MVPIAGPPLARQLPSRKRHLLSNWTRAAKCGICFFVTPAASSGARARTVLCVVALVAGAASVTPAGAAPPTISILDPRDIVLDYARLVTAKKAPNSLSVAVRNEASRPQHIDVRVLKLVRSPGEAPLKQFLNGLTLDRLIEIVAPAAPATIPPSPTALFPPGTADELWILIWYAQPAWGWDIDTQTPRLRSVREDSRE